MAADFLLPSGKRLANFSAHFHSATMNRDGTATVRLILPAEEKPHVLALSDNEGMLINFTAWETLLPDGAQELAAMVGLVPKALEGD